MLEKSKQGLEVEFELRADEAIVKRGRLCVPSIHELKDVVLEKALSSTYAMHREAQRCQKDSLTLCQCQSGSGSTLLWIFYLGYLALLMIMMIDDQSERTIQIIKDMLTACVHQLKGSWDTHLSLMKFAYNNNYQSSISMAPFEALYGGPSKNLVCWNEVESEAN
ncbi:reverse transcriptase [Cucumis melo var. makuwa]|uniref:Reverse transcriptase n=1 Tax=Cucumis melo var. makuwa TaxID=1194695 RepID=A0A5D3CIA6_CUCMM|nr:reverse transcriptase [Cucumis melo var. makuwa]